MVRDRVCETFIPEKSALRLEEGGKIHYFCSSTCRDDYLARQTPR
jgi:YHS domain-containing protein